MSKAEELLSLYEMANLEKEVTGSDYIIWVSPKGKSRHGARIKVSAVKGKMDAYNTVSITIEDKPKVIGKGLSKAAKDQAIKFIIKNKEILLDYWEGKILTGRLISELESI